MSYQEITKLKFLGGNRLPESTLRIRTNGTRGGSIQLATNVSERFQSGRTVNDSGSEIVSLGIAYDPEAKAVKLLPDSVNGFRWSQKGGSALRLNMPVGAIRAGVQNGDYQLVGPTENYEFKLAE